jgi:hypothetical protein
MLIFNYKTLLKQRINKLKNIVKSKQTCKWQDPIKSPKQVIEDYIKEIESKDYYIKWLFQNQLWYNFHQQILNKFEALYSDSKKKV